MARIVLGSEEARRTSSCWVIPSCSASRASRTNWSAVTPRLVSAASVRRCIAQYAARSPIAMSCPDAITHLAAMLRIRMNGARIYRRREPKSIQKCLWRGPGVWSAYGGGFRPALVGVAASRPQALGVVGGRGQARPCASQGHPQAALEAATRKRVAVVRIGSVWPPQSFEGPPPPNTGRTAGPGAQPEKVAVGRAGTIRSGTGGKLEISAPSPRISQPLCPCHRGGTVTSSLTLSYMDSPCRA